MSQTKSGKPRKRQKPAFNIVLTEEQEDQLAELLNSPRCRFLYDKMEPLYRNLPRKEAVWEEVGREAGGFSAAEIQQAYCSLRTTMVRYTPSGSGTQKASTARREEIKRRFGFLRCYVSMRPEARDTPSVSLTLCNDLIPISISIQF